MIAIVDYGLGNISAFANVYKKLDLPFFIASSPETLGTADKIILPGVGAFDEAMDLLRKSGMRELLEEMVLGRRIPVLGICVGMQMLASSSEEGRLPGLGWIDGVVRKFEVSNLAHKTRLPHMGWNQVSPKNGSPLMRDLSEGSRFYFLHSYYFQCNDRENVLAETEYGSVFSCAVNSGNIFGVQFHPEKSHSNGIQLLKNFGTL